MKRNVFAAASMSVLLVAMLVPGSAAAARPQRFEQGSIRRSTPGLKDALANMKGNRPVEVAVQLRGQPVSTYEGVALAVGTSLSLGRKQDIRRTLGTRQRVTAARLRSLGATIQYSYTDVFNGFRIRVKAKQLDTIAHLPNVQALLTVPRHVRDNVNTVPYIGADKTWGQTGKTGKGVTIAIIDTGINYYHVDFAGKGNAAWKADDSTIREPGTFPTSKVIGGYDLVGDTYNADTQPVPHPDPDPLDCKAKAADQHGTHVAGTAAGTGVTDAGKTYTGPYDAHTLANTDFRIGPGVAPQAKLLAYRVFGCEGSTDVVVDAIERAVQGGADVISMSLGSPFGDAGSLDSVASDNASLAGVVVVASAGNEGASAYITGSPAAATRSIAVAAVDAVPDFPGARLNMATGSNITGIDANDAPLPVSGTINVFHDDPSTVVDDTTGQGDESLGCFAGDYDYNHFHAGQIAVTFRGICARTDRAVQGQAQHAAAVIMVNNASSLPPFENTIRGVTIPFIGVDGGDADRFTADDGQTVKISSAGMIANSGYKGNASFSSAGPRGGDSAIKPDISAPGVSVFSADGGTTGQGKSLSGTSMAAPAVAGVAALIRQAHPSWDPRAVKAAIVSTASAGKVDPYDLRIAGAGLVQPRKAVDTVAFVYTDPGSSSLAFGSQEAGKAPGSSNSFTETRKMTIRNTSGHAIRYDLGNTFNGSARGVVVHLSPGSVSVPANSKASVNVRISLSESAVAALPAAAPNHSPNLAVDDFGNFYTPVTTVRGAIIATPRSSRTGVYALRVPWLVVPKGLSDVRVNGSRAPYTGSGETRTSSIKFRNFGLHKGIVDVYAWGLSDDRENVGEVDLRAAGVQSLDSSVCTGSSDAADRCLVFAINTWHPWSNAAADEFDVLVDVNKDGEEDYALFSADDGLMFTGEANGITDAFVLDLGTSQLVDVFDSVVSADGSTILLPALASDFGLDENGPASFEYFVRSYAYQSDNLFSDVMHTGDTGAGANINARFNAFAPSLSAGYFRSLSANKSTSIPLKVNTSTYRSQLGQKGWLVVTLDDRNGADQADMVPVGALP
jgi:minor extracellular serine protease Vpr